MKKNDNGIYGIGSTSGGTYKNLKIAGSTTVNEDCKAEKISIAGSANFKQSVTAKAIKVAGSCHVGGNIKTEKLKVAGSFKALGNIDAEVANLAGVVTVEGDVNCEDFTACLASSSFKNIYGENITFDDNDGITSKTTVDEIAATTIEINNIKAKKISGEFVTIGNNCHVELIEYNNTLTVSKNSKIERIVKL